MSSKKYFSYIRVSTQKQGNKSTSLEEQQFAIERFAQTWNLEIKARFEERQTAAKQGRPIFVAMLKQLRQGKANGVIIHKIDRSARNLQDWVDLGSLVDSGIEVHFAVDGVDLNSRGGRLSADIQAVVASDYIRNLREEAKKGIYGRLKQGLFPFCAPPGYLDRGAGKPKEIDPVHGPLVRSAFEMYATGNWSLLLLSNRMYEMGLRNKWGGKVTRTGLSTILHSPFYFGLIRIWKNGQTYQGIHEPLISKRLFDQVQAVLQGKNIRKVNKHEFLYRRMIRCHSCKNLLVPEIQKGRYIYYRCHTSGCRKTILKEESVSEKFRLLFKSMQLSENDRSFFERESTRAISGLEIKIEAERSQISAQLMKISQRLSNLTDALIDGVIDQESYSMRKDSLSAEKKELTERLDSLKASADETRSDLRLFLELANSAYLTFNSASIENKRELIKLVTSNLSGEGKFCLIELKSALQNVPKSSTV